MGLKLKEKAQKEIAKIKFNNPDEYKVVKLFSDNKEHVVHQILAEKLVAKKKGEYVSAKIEETKIPNLKK